MKRLLVVIPILIILLVGSTPAEAQRFKWNDFASMDEFDTWIAVNHVQPVWGDGKPATCVDYALEMQAQALRAGYRLSVAYTYDGYVAPGIKVTNFMGMHWGNLVIIGNSVYWFEPQLKDYHIVYIGPIQGRRF